MPESYPLGPVGTAVIIGATVWLPMLVLAAGAVLGGLWIWGVS